MATAFVFSLTYLRNLRRRTSKFLPFEYSLSPSAEMGFFCALIGELLKTYSSTFATTETSSTS